MELHLTGHDAVRSAEVVLATDDPELGRRLGRLLGAQHTVVQVPLGPLEPARIARARIAVLVGRVSASQVTELLSMGGPRRVVVVSDERTIDVAALLRAGVMAVVPAADASRDVPPALEAVAAGAIYLSRSCTVELRQVLDRAATPASGLAPREIETLAWIARGCTHRQVAHHMQVTEATVNTYVKRLRSKLGVGNKAELAQAAWRLGLMENSPGPVVSSTVHRSERVDVDVSRT